MATYYWVGGTGTWNASATAHWSASTGGSAGAGFPTAADNVIIDSLSGTGTITCTTASATCLNLTVTATQAITLASSLSLIYGGLTYPASGSFVSSANLVFVATSGSNTITTNGITVSGTTTFNGVGGTWVLGSALTSSTTVSLSTGTLSLASYTLTCINFSSNNSNTRVIAFGTGNIAVTGNNQTVFTMGTATGFTYTGTPTVNLTYSGSVGTRTFTFGGSLTGNETNALDFYILSGTDITAVSNASHFGTLNFTGFTGTFTRPAQGLYIYRNLVFGTGMTYTPVANGINCPSTVAVTQTITGNGVTIDSPILLNGSAIYTLGSALTIGTTYGNIGLTQGGTLNLAGYTCTTPLFYTSTGTLARNLTFNGGTLVCTGTGTNAFSNPGTNFTTTAGTGSGTISMTAASAKTFEGGGVTYNCTLSQAGAGALSITGANTFSNITNTVTPATITFPASTTNNFVSFNLLGTSGNLITINSSTSGTQATVNYTGVGTVTSVNYLTIQDSNATPAFTWYAGSNSTNVSNNTGWAFTYILSLSETTTLTDTNVVSQNFPVIENSSTQTLTNSQTVLAAFVGAQTNTTTLTNSQTGLVAFLAALTETTTLTDTNVVSQNFPVIENSSTQTLTDAESVLKSMFANLLESTTISDYQYARGWFKINDSQSVTWVPVNDSQPNGWALIDDTQTPNWAPVDDSQ